ncbi:hypothetical protein MYX64_01650 [Nitrospinae bacterium AH_259_B05_G02_I21]|nr:hypothetical protein [Nitrospinae bacterium AH_259_B05_G02_I21]MDA2932142.1 hypothetical protein [Nitrospinae bacterium AH-259-F20]
MSDQETTNEPEPQESEEDFIQLLKERIANAVTETQRNKCVELYPRLEEMRGEHHQNVLDLIRIVLENWKPEPLREERADQVAKLQERYTVRKLYKKLPKPKRRAEETVRPFIVEPIDPSVSPSPSDIEWLEHFGGSGRRPDDHLNILIAGSRDGDGTLLLPGLVDYFTDAGLSLNEAYELTKDVLAYFFGEHFSTETIRTRYRRAIGRL